MTLMANYWSDKEWQVTLITLSDHYHDFYYLESGVKRIGLNCLGPSRNALHACFWNIKRLRLLRQEIEYSSPDVIISFMDRMNVMTLLASMGLNIPILISERIDPREHVTGKIWTFLRNRLYVYAKILIVQSSSVKGWATENWPQLSNTVIFNPVIIPIKNKSDYVLNPTFKWCVAMGRLTDQKGFDILLSAFSKLIGREGGDHWRLVILGEGEQRSLLEKQCRDLGIKEYVQMPGRVKNPADYLYKADLFILSSRYEGFPNALLEAMACGLPVISANCPSGPAEIIQHNVDGILVESENSNVLADAMERLVKNEKLRTRLAHQAVESVRRFSPEVIMEQWESLIYESLEK